MKSNSSLSGIWVRSTSYPTNGNGYRSRCGCLVQIRQICIFRVWWGKERIKPIYKYSFFFFCLQNKTKKSKESYSSLLLIHLLPSSLLLLCFRFSAFSLSPTVCHTKKLIWEFNAKRKDQIPPSHEPLAFPLSLSLSEGVNIYKNGKREGGIKQRPGKVKQNPAVYICKLLGSG